MKRFTDAGRKALAANNFYAALAIALTLPDICASLEDPGPGKAHARFVRWFSKWAEPKFTIRGTTYVSAEDCFQLRCSLIHSGSAEIEETKRTGIDRFEFMEDPSAVHLGVMSGNSINGVVQPSAITLNVPMFCESMYGSADEWDASIANDIKLQKSKESLLVIHPAGAVVQGTQFGMRPGETLPPPRLPLGMRMAQEKNDK